MSFAEDQRKRRQVLRDMEVVAPPRSTKWRSLREEHIRQHPRCEACGNTNAAELTAHHCQPYHLFPELELDPNNLITLCEFGVAGTNCHLLVGHCGFWGSYNKTVNTDTFRMQQMLAKRVVGVVTNDK